MIRFLHPEALYFLLLLIIPIIVHLFNFRRYKTLYFSNVRFLKDVQNRTKSSSRLKNILILLSRLLAFTFIIFAFARPFSPSLEQSSTGKKYVSIYLDNSFSMDSENEDGNLFELSRQYALLLLEEFAESDRFFILSNELNGTGIRALQKEQAIEVLSELELSSSSRNLSEIHRRQLIGFEPFKEDEKLSFWISDFQSHLFHEEIELDSSIVYRLIPVQAPDVSNLSLDSLWFNDPVRRPSAIEELSFTLENHGNEDLSGVQVRYVENGLIKSSMPVDIGANSKATYSLGFTGPESGFVRAHLEIEDYPVQFDDKLFLNYIIRQNRNVLLIHQAGKNLPLLKVFDDALFQLTESSLLEMDYSSLVQYDLIILAENGPFGSGFIQQISQFVENGGSFLIIPEGESNSADYTEITSALQLPKLGAVVNQTMRISQMNKESALIKGVFRRIPDQMDFPTTQKHFNIEGSALSYSTPLFSYADGSPFWAYQKNGDGYAHMMSVPLEPEWSNWSNHALFPVIMFQLAFLSDQQTLYHTMGKADVVRIEKAGNWVSNDLPVELRGEEANFILSEVKEDGNSIEMKLAGIPHSSGHYGLYKQNELVGQLSFNYSSSEGDLRVSDLEQLKSWMELQGIDTNNLLEARSDQIEAVLSGLDFSGGWWKWCILISLLFLCIEIILIKVLRP